jgi:small subunit ribosomal protein S6
VKEYEFTFVVQPELSDEGVEAISTRFEGILASNASEKLFYEDWGRRRLAYEIRNFQKGHYRVLHFLSDGQVIPELERSARLDDSVLRFLTVLAADGVEDVEGRRAEAVKLEEERVKRAAERAERDAEDAARAAEETARAAEESARAAEAAAEADASDAPTSEEAADAPDEADSDGDAGDAAADAGADSDETPEKSEE